MVQTAEAVTSKGAAAFMMDAIAPEALSTGEIIQLPDGRAGITASATEVASGDVAGLHTHGQFRVLKTDSIVILDGGKVFWDRSANTATPLQAAAGADFYLGVAVGDAASGDATVVIDLNVRPTYTIDFMRDPGDTVVVLTAGTPFALNRGASLAMGFSATAEAQKVDWISEQSVPVTIPMILECIFCVATVCDADVGDFSIGLANATHASDMDTATETALFHQDSGADVNLDVEADDGVVEVAAADTGVDLVAGAYVEGWIDARDLTDVKFYVAGQRVVSGSTFQLDSATGPLKAICHLEKTSNDSPGEFRVSHLAIRTPDVT